MGTYLGVNYYEGKKYFSKENMEDLVDQLSLQVIHQYNNILIKKVKTKVKQIGELERFSKKVFIVNGYIKKTAKDCGYLYDKFLEIIFSQHQEKVINKKKK
jgi:hypothetical protein